MHKPPRINCSVYVSIRYLARHCCDFGDMCSVDLSKGIGVSHTPMTNRIVSKERKAKEKEPLIFFLPLLSLRTYALERGLGRIFPD